MSYDNAVLFFDSGMNNQRLFLLQSVEWMADQDKKKMQVNIPNFHTPLTSSELICLMKGVVGRESLERLKPQKTEQDNWFTAEVGVEQNDGSLRVSIGMDLFNAIKDQMNFKCEVPSKVEMPSTVEMPSKVKTSSKCEASCIVAGNHALAKAAKEPLSPVIINH